MKKQKIIRQVQKWSFNQNYEIWKGDDGKFRVSAKSRLGVIRTFRSYYEACVYLFETTTPILPAA